MDLLSASNERQDFASRLHEALTNAGEPTSATACARAFNLRANGDKVSSHGVRKWLKGEAYPTQEKILVLARWLNVQPSWLRYGERKDAALEPSDNELALLSTRELMLIHDIGSLPPSAQTVVRDLVDSLLRICSEPLPRNWTTRGTRNKD